MTIVTRHTRLDVYELLTHVDTLPLANITVSRSVSDLKIRIGS